MEVCEGLLVRNQLLQVVSQATAVTLTYRTTRRCELSVVWVAGAGHTGLIHIGRSVDSELQALVEEEVCETIYDECVTLAVRLVQPAGLQCIRVWQQRTSVTCITLRTVVIHLVAVLVDDDVTLSVTDINRIDRSHLRCKCKDVSSRTALTLAVVTIAPTVVSVCHINTNLQPLLCLVVSLQTSGQTVHLRALDDTCVVEVTNRGVEVRTLCCARDAHIVLLTERCAISLVHPVVRVEHILLTLV